MWWAKTASPVLTHLKADAIKTIRIETKIKDLGIKQQFTGATTTSPDKPINPGR
jgi:hypothetical protein